MAETKRPKKGDQQTVDWKKYPPEDQQLFATGLVHFSAKGVNSNVDDCGVRLDEATALDLPYVSVRCLMKRGLALRVDYTGNAANAKRAQIVHQLVYEGLAGRLETEVDQRQASVLAATLQHNLASSFAKGTENVSPRLRQILLPKDGNYVALTPLPSAGLSKEINARAMRHNELAKENGGILHLKTGILSVGGSHPSNVGFLASEMQMALVFDAPLENFELRRALAIHHKGIRFKLPRKPMLEWRRWREDEKAKNNGMIPTGMEARQTEYRLLMEIAHAMLQQGAQALHHLRRCHAGLPGGKLLSDGLKDPVVKGLIDPSERGKDWPQAFGEKLAREIGHYSFGEKLGVEPLDQASLNHIARWAEELVR